MGALFLVLATLTLCAQQVAQKEYDKRARGGAYTYVLVAVLSACLVFVLTSGFSLQFRFDVFLYSALFAFGYCLSMITGFLAIKTGALSLSALVIQYSLILPAIYGMVMLGEPLKITRLIGLGFLVVSLFLIVLTGKEKESRPSLKWAIYAFLAFFGNGACSTVQKVQQVDFDGQYKSEFMIAALLISAVVVLILVLLFERRELFHNLRHGGLISMGSGVANGLCNYFMMALAVLLPASVVFPVVSAGGTIAITLVALFVYRERLTKRQLVGIGLGIIAIVALNL